MASGGNFGGDGSIRWDVTTDDDDDKEKNHKQDGNKGWKSGGVDKSYGSNFVISLRIPTGVPAATFIAQLGNLQATSGNRVEITLPIEDRVSEQIRIRWAPVKILSA